MLISRWIALLAVMCWTSAGRSCRKKRATPPWPQGEGAPQGASGVLFTATPSGGHLMMNLGASKIWLHHASRPIKHITAIPAFTSFGCGECLHAVFLKVLGDSLRELFVKCADILLKPSQTRCVYTLAEYLTWQLFNQFTDCYVLRFFISTVLQRTRNLFPDSLSSSLLRFYADASWHW